MKLKNVKKGQRVELKVSCNNPYILVGSRGTIIEEYNDIPIVEWDNYGKYAVYCERLRKIKE